MAAISNSTKKIMAVFLTPGLLKHEGSFFSSIALLASFIYLMRTELSFGPTGLLRYISLSSSSRPDS